MRAGVDGGRGKGAMGTMRNEMEEPMSYVAVDECGCVVAICAVDPVMADEVAQWIKDGLTVEQQPKSVAVERFCRDCTHATNEQPALFAV
jgi:hypothetical protein